jgi:hypothetical protein
MTEEQTQQAITAAMDSPGHSGDEAASYLDWIRSNSKQWLVAYSTRRVTLESEIAATWGEAFDRFDLLVVVSQRALDQSNQALREDAVARHDVVYEALLPLAVRACQIGKEVRVLMGSGYAQAAQTRWRTSHEVHVVARLIEMHGIPLAERYLKHNIVIKQKLSNATEGVFKQSGLQMAPSLVQTIAEVGVDYAKLKQIYANEPKFFEGEYGWAAGIVGKADIVNLEKAAGLGDRRFAYRIASDSIHPNIAGAFAGSKGTSEGGTLMLGPSAEGMMEPGVSTALALVETIRIFLRHALAARDTSDTKGEDFVRQLALTAIAYDGLLQDTVDAFQQATATP